MTEHVTIRIEVFRTPQGEPTCCENAFANQMCRWLSSRKFGLVPMCGMNFKDLDRRGADGTGYLVPDDRCPLWQGETK